MHGDTILVTMGTIGDIIFAGESCMGYSIHYNEYCMDTASTGSIEVQHSLGGGGYVIY